MLTELIASGSHTLASDLLERTASAPRVQQIVQLSLAPAFLLSAIGAIMNVMMSRLVWVAQRIERLEERIEDGLADHEQGELAWLNGRRTLAQRAVALSTAAAVSISVVIALLFISAYVRPQIGTVIAVLWVITMTLLVAGLGFFLAETRLATKSRKWRDAAQRRSGSNRP